MCVLLLADVDVFSGSGADVIEIKVERCVKALEVNIIMIV
jgi:hypothetical protein